LGKNFAGTQGLVENRDFIQGTIQESTWCKPVVCPKKRSAAKILNAMRNVIGHSDKTRSV
jgi:hypothetical protein